MELLKGRVELGIVLNLEEQLVNHTQDSDPIEIWFENQWKMGGQFWNWENPHGSKVDLILLLCKHLLRVSAGFQ